MFEPRASCIAAGIENVLGVGEDNHLQGDGEGSPAEQLSEHVLNTIHFCLLASTLCHELASLTQPHVQTHAMTRAYSVPAVSERDLQRVGVDNAMDGFGVRGEVEHAVSPSSSVGYGTEPW